MQLGITIPLQKFLKWKPPVYGEPENLFFCWDLHVIRFHGENTLMAVNASNAFTVILRKWSGRTGKIWNSGPLKPSARGFWPRGTARRRRRRISGQPGA
ncbi:DUF6933 domain-containing protein, partial [Enterocloster lavalensis]|uniref:DUF6933 domain-containing protein n=1 Tax=Enterocloster lavalensis TaxID=460384 RepID=UPI003F5DD668